MPEASDTQGILFENLQDAGCGTELVQKCMELAQERKQAELVRLLSHHKKALLNSMHGCQKNIDCLDYLLYRINKNEY